ncbi:MAG: hypothetical protein K2G99_08040 [Desulfovibrio sp.]|nr:hypothetical protein [Desulfovibrio sp.]
MSAYRFVLVDTPELRRLPFERMEALGMTRAVLWHRARPSLMDWLESVDPLNAVCYLAYGGEELAGACWLNPVVGVSGFVHFAIFKTARPDWQRLGRCAIHTLFLALQLKSLLAFWPAHFRHVGRAAAYWGFGEPLLVPGGCPMPTTKRPARCRDGHMAVLTRGTFYERFPGGE